jgi:hypothetical protein
MERDFLEKNLLLHAYVHGKEKSYGKIGICMS